MRLFDGVYYRAPRVIEALRGLSSEAKRFWAYTRFREYPTRPAKFSEAEACGDLALARRTLRRAKRELLTHDPPLFVVHQRGTRNADAQYHALLPGETPPSCCEGQWAKTAPSRGLQPAKACVSIGHVGTLTGAKLAGSNGATPCADETCAPHKTGKGGKVTEKETGGRPPRREGGGAALEKETDPARRAVQLVVGAKHFDVHFSDLTISNTDGYTIGGIPDRTRRDTLEKWFGADLRSELGRVRFELTAPTAQKAVVA